MKIGTTLIFLAASLTGASGSTPTGVMGDWATPNRSVVQIYACGSAVCAKIAKLSSAAPDKNDVKNPDSSLRSRPLCGMNISTDFKQIDATHLDKGHLYDPESGRTYSGTIVAQGDQLSLRGYIGISLLGRTEIWHRVPTDNRRCD